MQTQTNARMQARIAQIQQMRASKNAVRREVAAKQAALLANQQAYANGIAQLEYAAQQFAAHQQLAVQQLQVAYNISTHVAPKQSRAAKEGSVQATIFATCNSMQPATRKACIDALVAAGVCLGSAKAGYQKWLHSSNRVTVTIQ